jgi:hypothetical protein
MRIRPPSVTDGPSLVDLLQIVGGGGLALGGFCGLLVTARDGRQMIQNLVLWSAVGLWCGTMIAFALWAAIELNGGVG